jgi:hypothetical protein
MVYLEIAVTPVLTAKKNASKELVMHLLLKFPSPLVKSKHFVLPLH